MTLSHPLAADLDGALEGAEDDIRAIAGGRLFIAGGTGFVGTWLAELLVWAVERMALDLQVVALTRSADSWMRRHPRLASSGVITPVEGDARTFAFPVGAFEIVVLGASSTDHAWTTAHPEVVTDTITNGTKRGLEFADAAGASRTLLLSSGAVYGRQPPALESLGETYVGEPSTADAYGRAKRAAEALALTWSRPDHPAVVARIFSVYGPYQPIDTHFAIGNFIADALAGRPVTVRSDGSPVRSYLYGSDLAVALLACLARGAGATAYNVGSADPVRLADLAVHVASQASPPVGVRILGPPAAVADRYVPDVRRITAELRFAPRVELADGIRRTLAFAATGHRNP